MEVVRPTEVGVGDRHAEIQRHDLVPPAERDEERVAGRQRHAMDADTIEFGEARQRIRGREVVDPAVDVVVVVELRGFAGRETGVAADRAPDAAFDGAFAQRPS